MAGSRSKIPDRPKSQKTKCAKRTELEMKGKIGYVAFAV
jgi:hypothetical protein